MSRLDSYRHHHVSPQIQRKQTEHSAHKRSDPHSGRWLSWRHSAVRQKTSRAAGWGATSAPTLSGANWQGQTRRFARSLLIFPAALVLLNPSYSSFQDRSAFIWLMLLTALLNVLWLRWLSRWTPAMELITVKWEPLLVLLILTLYMTL